MRAPAVRAAIVDAIEAISPTSQVSTEDVFRIHDYDTPARDRAFRVDRIAPQSPARSLLTTIGSGADAYRLSFVLSCFYMESRGTTERKLEDGDQILDALRGLPGDHVQIRNVEITGGIDTLDPGGFWLVSWDIVIEYDRRDA